MTPLFSDELISTIAERISIVDLVSSYVPLKKAGKHYKGLCPFHPDTNPSLIVNEERNLFHCFGCGAGGDVYQFFMKFHNCTFHHAVRELAQRAGIRISTKATSEHEKRAAEAREQAYRLNTFASELFHRYLLKGDGAQIAREVFSKRGITPSIIEEYQLGFAPNQWDFLLEHIKRHKFALHIAEDLGLIVPKKSGQGYYDRFRNRLMFPIFDTSGRILGFGGRAIGDEEPKYMNSPESFLYNKRASLYGLSHAQHAIRSYGYAILVEGYFDVLTLHRCGFRHTVGVLGTSVTSEQIDLLARFTRKVVFVFDGDPAGKKAAMRNVEAFLDKGLQPRCMFLVEGHDPDSYLVAHGPESFNQLLQNAPHALYAILEEKRSEAGSLSPEQAVEVLNDITPLVSKIKNPIERDLHVRTISETLGIDESLLRAELSNYSGKVRASVLGREKDAPSTLFPEERLICVLLVQFPHLLDEFKEPAAKRSLVEHIRNEHVRTIIEQIFQEHEQTGTISLSRLLARVQGTPAVELVSSCACTEEVAPEQALRALNDSMRRMLLRDLREEARDLNRKIREAEKRQQLDVCLELSMKKRELLQRGRDLMGQHRP